MLSTAFGFAMLLSSPSPPIQNIGITIGFAMLANLVICLIYLPNWLLKTAADKRENRCQMALSGALKKLAVMLDDQGTVVMLAIFLISAVAIAGFESVSILTISLWITSLRTTLLVKELRLQNESSPVSAYSIIN